MSWSTLHEESEKLASAADVARWRGDAAAAEADSVAAARWEVRALHELGPDEPRTYGITAVSAAALFYKGKEFAEAEKVAREALKAPFLPDFAKTQLQEILQAIGLEQKNERTLQALVQQILEFMYEKIEMTDNLSSYSSWKKNNFEYNAKKKSLNFFQRAVAEVSLWLVIIILITLGPIQALLALVIGLGILLISAAFTTRL